LKEPSMSIILRSRAMSMPLRIESRRGLPEFHDRRKQGLILSAVRIGGILS
jgi:hypothetical protein